MAILGHRSASMSMVYSRLSDPVVKEQYEQVLAGGGRIAGPAAEILLAEGLDDEAVHWLKTNFFKTELELGHCLRLPQEGPCECDLYLRCSKFFTTTEYAPRLRQRLTVEQDLIQDATERGWARESSATTPSAAALESFWPNSTSMKNLNRHRAAPGLSRRGTALGVRPRVRWLT